MESTREDPRIGLVLNGRYRITAPLGEGGMGLVYRGERVELGRPVAIKFLHTPYADSSKFVTRFQREARAMSRLSHPYCVSVLDFGVHEEPYIIMDFVTGSTLREVLDERRLTPARALAILRQVLIGLAHAHDQGVIHRDIKPGNIMLSEATGLGDHVRIFDFGLAKLHDPDAHGEASIAAVIGTPAYMSPEQARAENVDARADLYSAGVLLFEMLTGQKPFEAANAYELLRLQRDKEAPRLRTLASELSTELEAVVAKALTKEPRARYQTAAEFGAALEAVPEWSRSDAARPVESDAALANTQIGTSSTPRRSARRERSTTQRAPRGGRTWAFVALLLVAALGFARFRYGPLFLSKLAGGASTPAHATAREESKSPREEIAATKRERGSHLARPPEQPRPEEPAPEAPLPDLPAPEEAAQLIGEQLRKLGDALSGDQAKLPEEETKPAQDEARAVQDESAELSDDALAAADEALQDDREQEVVLTATPAPQKSAVRSVADVRSLIAKGQTEAAIRGIQQLRRTRPRDAQLPFLLGNLYCDKGWYLDGLAKYRETISLAGSYRKNPRIHKHAIDALGHDRGYPRARALLVRHIGRAALVPLRRAAQRDDSALVRRRAGSIAKQIAR